MSKKLKRSAVALVLAATMVFSSQGVLTAFAVGENETSTAVDVSALEPILDKEETVVVEGPSNTDETETPEVEVCEECQGENGNHAETCSHYVDPTTPPNGSTNDENNNNQEQQECTCGAEEGQPHEEGCPLYEEPEAPVCTCGAEEGQPHEEGCPLYEEPTVPECTCGAEEGQPHEEGCPLYEENTEDTEDTQEPSEEDVAAVQAVVDVINSLPTTDDLANYTPTIELKPEDEGYQEAYQAALDAYYSQVQEKVKAARAAYDALTEEQKAAFDATVLAKLTALEELIAMREQADVLPTGDPETAVAKIGEDNYYDTLDDAITNATDGDVIEILKDCSLSSFPSKSLTFTGNGKISLNSLIRADMSSSQTVTFTGDGLEFEWSTVGLTSEPNTDRWLLLSMPGTFNVTDGATVRFVMDSHNDEGAWKDSEGRTKHIYPVCAIYVTSTSKINISNNATFEIKGINSNVDGGQGIQSESSSAQINVTNNGHFLIDGTNRGYVSSPTILIENSTFTVQNCTSNASNGGKFTATKGSTITYQNNAGHGLSAGDVTIEGSKFTADNNGYYGLYASSGFYVDSTSTVKVTHNSHGGDFAGLKLTSGVTNGLVESGATVNITGNYCSGLSNNGKCVFEDGVKLTITGNNNDKGSSSHGGGIYNSGASANLALPSNAVIYNNHALTDGDDIFNNTTATITFGKVGSDWVLDDTNLPITNWFYDGKKDGEDTNRWSVGNYYEVFTPGAITGLQAIKAAHQYSYNPDTPTIPDGDFEWETSKSKHAEELEKQADGTYTSNVTLSLPAADFEPEIDVVFVIDDTHAGSGIFAGSVEKLLNELCAKDNLDINIGVVTFDAIARDWLQVTSNGELSGLVSLNEHYDPILEAINTELTADGEGALKRLGGSNTEWPLAMANEMLSRGNGSEQHVVMFSDMFGYVYRGDLIVGDTTYHDVPLSKKLGNSDKGQLCISSPKYDTWEDVKNHIDEDEPQYDTFFRDPQWASYWTNYGVGEVPDIDLAPKASVPQYGEGLVPYSYITPFEKSCYLTYSEAIELMNNGVHLTFINNDFNPGDNGETIQTIRTGMLQDLASNGATFIQKETANGATLDENQMEEVFTALENKLLYVVDAGSQVIDVIGEGKDNKGNDYNFDFVDVVSLIVGGEEYEIHHEEGSDIYYFGTSNEDGVYPFVLTYYPDGFGVSAMNNEDNEDSIQEIIAGELFIWDINVPITVDEPVQLTYTVKLTNPQTAYGTYGEYDANGENGSTSLYTNNSAILYPVDSTGVRGAEEAFLKPTVSYTVGNGNVPGTDPTPDPDPDPDRPSRPNRDDDDWEPLPNAPVKEDKPAAQTPAQQETETPTAQQPDKYNPETGDTTTVFAAMALAAVSLGGVVLLGRKKK